MNFITHVIIYNNKAFTFTILRADGVPHYSEPVYTTNLNIAELTEVLNIAIKEKNPEFSNTDLDNEWIKSSKILIKYTHAKSQKQLVKNSLCYYLLWEENILHVSMSEWGSWDIDYVNNRNKILPADTDMNTIAKIIIDDALSHPEVLSPPVIIQKPRKNAVDTM